MAPPGERAIAAEPKVGGRPSAILCAAPYASLLGFAGLVSTMALGFERPHAGILAVATVFLVAAPVVLLFHLAVTREMSGAGRRWWVRALLGRRGPRLAAAYFRADKRRRLTRRFASRAE